MPAPPFPDSMLENSQMQTCFRSILHRGGEGQNAYKMKFPNPCGQGCSFYIMPQKIQSIRTQESRCIFNGITPNLPITCRSYVALTVLVTVFSRAAWYKMQHVLVVYHGLPHLPYEFYWPGIFHGIARECASQVAFIIWFVFVPDITRALIG